MNKMPAPNTFVLNPHQPWWTVKPDVYNAGVFHHAENCLSALAAAGGRPVEMHYYSEPEGCHMLPGMTLTALTCAFKETFPEFWLVTASPKSRVFAHDFGVVSFSVDNFFIGTALADAELAAKVAQWVAEYTTRTEPKGRVYVVVTTQNGPEFKAIGIGGEPLERRNYTPQVLTGYDRAISDLNSDKPRGRIAIFSGAPGTGKTFLTRALLNDVVGGTCVIVPPAMVPQLTGPNFMPALLEFAANNQTEEKKGRLIFIIEDADECLAARMADNMTSVATLLNLGDGIVGRLLDVRIVATTNADHTDIDKAILRPGRLSVSVEVGQLEYCQAQEVYAALAPGRGYLRENGKGRYSLAEIYQEAAAAESGQEAVKSAGSRGMGFAP
jgi:hypothetical protein